MTLKVFEIFSGYGGASFGLKKARIDFECIGISEIDKYATQVYNLNHPNVKNYGDCTKIDPNELPDFDLLTGGFPCQDVSLAGKKDLSRGRTNLYKEILRIIEVKKPKYLLLENVKGLLYIGKERKLIDIIVSDLKKRGYGVIWKVLNSKDYGTPQNRERVWFVCKFGGWEFNEFQFPNPIRLEKKLLDLTDEIVEDKYYITDKQYFRYLKRSDRRNKPIQKRTNPKISTCLTTKSPKNSPADSIIIKDSKGIRTLTPTECFRLMGLNEINLGNLSDTQKYHLSGNGWDVNVVSKIFKQMFRNI